MNWLAGSLMVALCVTLLVCWAADYRARDLPDVQFLFHLFMETLIVVSLAGAFFWFWFRMGDAILGIKR